MKSADHYSEARDDVDFGFAPRAVPVAAVSEIQVERSGPSVVMSWKSVGILDGVTLRVHREEASGYRSPLSDDLDAGRVESWTHVAAPQTEVTYWLELELAGGANVWQGPLIVAATEAPTSLGLRMMGANPIRGETAFSFSLPTAGNVRVAVYDVRGRLVATVTETTSGPGQFVTKWDGRADDGSAVAAGVYYALLQQGIRQSTLKLVVVR